MTTRSKTAFAMSIAFITVALTQTPLVSQGPQDFKAKARIRTELHFRQQRLEEMRKATEELVALTKALVEEVEVVDGYTTSAKLVESSDKIEKLAKKIENLAKTVKKRARGR